MKGSLRLCLFVLLATATPAAADDLRPLYIEIAELGQSVYKLQIRTPPNVMPDNSPNIIFPDGCRTDQPLPHGGRVSCRDSILGSDLAVSFPRREVPNSTIVKVNLIGGESHTMALASGVRRFTMPRPETVAAVATQYTRLGAEHIWIGLDHLLFLLCLIWIAGTWRRIVITVTGFTIAHSLTLALSALKIVALPVPPVEAAIALSVLFLATEIVKGRRASLTWRHPIAVSCSFGLLHGLGFAAVLSEIGLPRTEVLTGLVFFNVGVEIGQVVFALGVVLLLRLGAALLGESMHDHARPVMGYAVGCMSAYWLIDRIAAF